MIGRRLVMAGVTSCAVLVAMCVATAPAHAATCDGIKTPCAVGDTGPGGGTVFYAAKSRQAWGRYLEAAPSGWTGKGSADPKAVWCAQDSAGYHDWFETGTGIGAGAKNTAMLVKACGTKTAAGIAAALKLGGRSDWYLPSKNELNALYRKRSLVDGVARNAYWTSTQADTTGCCAALYQDFSDGTSFYADRDSTDYRVRPIRAF